MRDERMLSCMLRQFCNMLTHPECKIIAPGVPDWLLATLHPDSVSECLSKTSDAIAKK